MRSIALSKVGLVWLVLVLATIFSWWLAPGHVDAVDRILWPGVVLLVVAFAKVHLIGMHFMELRGAPRLLRWTFDAWGFGVCALLIAQHLTM